MPRPAPNDALPLLLRRVVALDPASPTDAPSPAALSAALIERGRIAWLGDDADAPAAPGLLQLDGHGAVLMPAFVDAHVHATAAGLALTGLDLDGATSAEDLLERVAAASRPGRILLGHGWDESRWVTPRRPTAAELARATGGSPAYLSRSDLHSALATPDLLAGVEHDEGRVRLEAHHAVRARALAAVSSAQSRDAQRATRAEAARLGIGSLHEMSGPEVASAEDLSALLDLAAAEPGPEIIAYWGALGDLDTAVALGAQPGGDLFVDGSFGSHTAALSEPYADDVSTSGALRYDAAAIAAHVLASARRGLQAGFHCIGDRAISAVLDGIERVEAELGLAAVRQGQHRLEHLELLDEAAIARVARLGLVASVQPAFDARWAGQMYPARLGAARSAATNPFAALHRAGVPLAFGSDAPVTPMDPWAGVRAAVLGQNPVDLSTALRAHIGGGAHAARNSDPLAGSLRAGAPASLALWRFREAGDLSSVLSGPAPSCAALVVCGRLVHHEL